MSAVQNQGTSKQVSIMSIYYETRYFSNLFVQVNRLQVNNKNLLFSLQGISVSFKGHLIQEIILWFHLNKLTNSL